VRSQIRVPAISSSSVGTACRFNGYDERCTSESETVSLVPQLAHLKSTSSVGGSIVDHRAPLTMKNAEPQLWQTYPFCRIAWRRHRAWSPEGCIPACYSPYASGAYSATSVSVIRPR
jgi:hypothetical protein